MPVFKGQSPVHPQLAPNTKARNSIGQASVQGAVGATAPCYKEATLVNLRAAMVGVQFPPRG